MVTRQADATRPDTPDVRDFRPPVHAQFPGIALPKLSGAGVGSPGTVGWNQSGGRALAGSHRAPRGGGRAAAREARRQQARKRNQTIAAGVAVVVLVGGGGVAALNAFGGDKDPGVKAGNGPSDDKPANSDVLADDKALLDAARAKTLAATGTWTVTTTADGDSAPDTAFACQSQRFADPSGLRTWVRTLQNSATKDTAVQYVD